MMASDPPPVEIPAHEHKPWNAADYIDSPDAIKKYLINAISYMDQAGEFKEMIDRIVEDVMDAIDGLLKKQVVTPQTDNKRPTAPP